MSFDDPREIECLGCGARRIAYGRRIEDTGECPRCRYVGWTYALDVDAPTREMILNGEFGRRGPLEPELAHETARRSLVRRECDWRPRHGRGFGLRA